MACTQYDTKRSVIIIFNSRSVFFSVQRPVSRTFRNFLGGINSFVSSIRNTFQTGQLFCLSSYLKHIKRESGIRFKNCFFPSLSRNGRRAQIGPGARFSKALERGNVMPAGFHAFPPQLRPKSLGKGWEGWK